MFFSFPPTVNCSKVKFTRYDSFIKLLHLSGLIALPDISVKSKSFHKFKWFKNVVVALRCCHTWFASLLFFTQPDNQRRTQLILRTKTIGTRTHPVRVTTIEPSTRKFKLFRPLRVRTQRPLSNALSTHFIDTAPLHPFTKNINACPPWCVCVCVWYVCLRIFNSKTPTVRALQSITVIARMCLCAQYIGRIPLAALGSWCRRRPSYINHRRRPWTEEVAEHQQHQHK